ncbi:MAG TPA: DinB family protein [Candidatus Limnocylindria bacterium]
MNVQLTAERSLALLRENASHLVSLTRDQPARSLARSPQPDEWSPNDVLAHIRACCDVWGGNIEKILAEEHATFQGVNPRTWLRRTDYPEWPFEKAVRAFSAQRRALLRTLSVLAPQDWERTAAVISYGQLSFERSVRSYASGLARHERTHVRQIEAALAPRPKKR